MIKEKVSGGTWFGRTVFESMGFVKTDPSLDVPDCQIHMLPWAYPSPNQDAPVRPTVDMRPAGRGRSRVRSMQASRSCSSS